MTSVDHGERGAMDCFEIFLFRAVVYEGRENHRVCFTLGNRSDIEFSNMDATSV